MDASRVDIAYRPLRVGWVLHSQDREALRLAMRLSFCLAGGHYNPIILVDQPEAEAIVRLFRVDMLELVGSSPEAAAFLDRVPHIPRPFMGPLFDVQRPHSLSSCQLLDVLNCLQVWSQRSDWAEWTDAKESGLQQPHWQDDDPLADIHLAEYGGFPTKEIVGRDYAGAITRSVPNGIVQRVEIDPMQPIPERLVTRHSLAFLSDHAVHPRQPRSRGWSFPGIYLGDGALSTDIVNFWNIRAANVPIRFIDHTRLDRYHVLAPAIARRVRVSLSGRRDPERQPAIWTTDEALAVKLADQVIPGGGITLCRVSEILWRFGVAVPSMLLGEASSLGVEAQSRVTFALPDRPYSSDLEFAHQHLVASVRIEDPTFGPDKRETFRLPFLPEHNTTLARELGVMHYQLRLEPERLGLVISTSRRDASVSALSVLELVSLLARNAGLTGKLSNGGLITQQLVSQLGGFEGARVFKIPGVRRLIRSHSATDSFTKQSALKLIGGRDPDRPEASFADHHQLYIEPRDPGTNLSSDEVFSYLVEKGVFRMGWDLKCPRCQLSAWVALDQLQQQHTCGYCGTGYDSTRQIVESPMAFRRSGLLGIQRHAQGAVPVALVLQQLANNLGHLGETALFLPSIEFTDQNDPTFRCESDIVGFFPDSYPGPPTILIGECKDRDGRIDADDVRKLATISDRIEATGLEVFILFAKLGPFTDEEILEVKTLNGEWRHRVILLTDRELEPYYIYERHTDEQGGRLHGGSIHELAMNSQRLYPALRRSPRQSSAPSKAGGAQTGSVE